jgi:putative ABC transport system permease protein
MTFSENIREALRSIRGNRLRAGLTIVIISLGITAMVGVLTSIDAIKFWLSTSFSNLGANTLTIQNRELNVQIGGSRRKQKSYPPITYKQAKAFKLKADGQMAVSLTVDGADASTLRYESRTTNANVSIDGKDENLFNVESHVLATGRPFTEDDLASAANVIILGADVNELLFPAMNAIGREVAVGKHKYRVIGVLESKGTSGGIGGDKICFLPITTVLNHYQDPNRSFVINCKVPDAAQINSFAEGVTGLFRLVRGLTPDKENNFTVLKSETFIANLMANLRLLTYSATAIAFITLFGASIGLMNMMLVSVTERTMEIGLRKALGATRRQILVQFLVEAICICQLGGLLGIMLGVGIGNLNGYFLESPPVLPWDWILLAVVLCFIVGLGAGLYPAARAARLDPIDSLRYE